MDNFVVSALKYRPATFRSVVGQHHITSTLKNAIARGQLAHAYLFCGPRGVGKTTCARIFAKAINCLSPVDNEACGECESCRSFNEGRSFNIHELDAASNNSVDDIRSLTEQVRIPPQIGRYSVYIIDEVHMLSASAFNAFLKTLEEPPAHAVFILATTEKHKIIPTILSRCQIFDFNRIRVEDGVEYLKYIAGQENVSADDESLHLIAMKADGGMRDALSMFDKAVSFCGNDLQFKEVARTLNVLDYDTYFNLTSLILGGDYPAVLTLFDEILRKGFSPQGFAGGLNGHFRDLLMSKNPQTLPLLEVSGTLLERYKQQGAQCPPQFLFDSIAVLTALDGTLRTATSQRLNVELGLMKLCGLGQKKNNDIGSPTLSVTNAELPPLKRPGATEGTAVAEAAPAASATQTGGAAGQPADLLQTQPAVAAETPSPAATNGEQTPPTAEAATHQTAMHATEAGRSTDTERAAATEVGDAQIQAAPDPLPATEISTNTSPNITTPTQEAAAEVGRAWQAAEQEASDTAAGNAVAGNVTTGTIAPAQAGAGRQDSPANRNEKSPTDTATRPAGQAAGSAARKSILGGTPIANILNGTKSLYADEPAPEAEVKAAPILEADPECERKIAENKAEFLSQLHRERPRIAMAMDDMTVEANRITLNVPTDSLYEEIMRNRTEILTLLADIAGITGGIELNVNIMAETGNRRPIKSEDKLTFLTEKNPALTLLRKELNLELE